MAYTKEQLEEANRYEDFAELIMYMFGMPIGVFRSKEYQIMKGESRGRVEIKNDKRFKETGNLYIETHEKQPEATEWVESGILRKDNSWFWFIGDYEKAWLFVKKQLRNLVDSKKFKNVETETSKGVVIPIKYFEQHPDIPVYVFNLDEVQRHIPYIE